MNKKLFKDETVKGNTMKNDLNPIVAIPCVTYNHEPYILQCLNGFVIQKTNFPFVAVVIDDASTDNEPKKLWEFINNELNPNSIQKDETNDYIRVVGPHKTNPNCTFVIILLKYNHFSIRKSRVPYYKEWYDVIKYLAVCEGDDYWTDPQKLQKQVDYLEAHPECTLVCNRTKIKSEKYLSFMDDNCCMNKDGVLDAKDVIRKGGLYISTCSLIYRSSLTTHYPEYCQKCHVGDYPLQILAAMKGSVYYINDPMSVYRVDNPTSWVGRTASKSIKASYLKGTRTEVNMLKGFAKDYAKYKSVFFQRIGYYITSVIYNYRNDLQSVKLIKDEYKEDINNSRFYNCFIKPKFE